MITIGGLKLYTYEIDIIYLLMEDDDSDWTVGDIAGSLPYIVDDLWDGIQSLILSGILERTDMTQTFDNIPAIKVTVPSPGRAWLDQHASDIDDAFILLNPDMFDVVEAAEA
mgnify:CR=1 FL=1